jgi:hypothetical protein
VALKFQKNVAASRLDLGAGDIPVYRRHPDRFVGIIFPGNMASRFFCSSSSPTHFWKKKAGLADPTPGYLGWANSTTSGSFHRIKDKR